MNSDLSSAIFKLFLAPVGIALIVAAFRTLPRRASWWCTLAVCLACLAVLPQTTKLMSAEAGNIVSLVFLVLTAGALFAAYQAWKVDAPGIRLLLSVFQGNKSLCYTLSLENPSVDVIHILGVSQQITGKSDSFNPSIRSRQVTGGDKAVLAAITESEVAFGDELNVEVFYRTEKGATRCRSARFEIPERLQDNISPLGGEDRSSSWSGEEEGTRGFLERLDSSAAFARVGLRPLVGEEWNHFELAGAVRTFRYDPVRRTVSLENTAPGRQRAIQIRLPPKMPHHVFMGWNDNTGWLALAVNGVGRETSSTTAERRWTPPDLAPPKC